MDNDTHIERCSPASRNFSPEVREKLSAALKSRWADPAMAARMRRHGGRAPFTPEERVRHTAAMQAHAESYRASTKKLWARPDYRLAQAKGRAHRRVTPEESALRAHICRTAMRTPEALSRRAAAHAAAIQRRHDSQAARFRASGIAPDCRDVEALRALVAEHGVYVSSLALYLGVHATNLHSWLRGETKPARKRTAQCVPS